MSLLAVTDACRAAMSEWQSDKPVAALMGEFSAGKSTLLNFLLGADVAPTKVTATPLPPVWFCYADTPFTYGLKADGSEEAVDLSDTEINFRANYVMIRKGVDCAKLKDCDIVDAPGISDPELRKDALRFLFTYIDFVIWCTAAGQAWRQTENAAYSKFAEATKTNSILIITRFDKLRSEKDRGKVLKRVQTEVHSKFASIVALQTPKAAAVAPADRTDDEAGAWVKTGGYAVEAALRAAIDAAKPKRRAARPATQTSKTVAPKPANKAKRKKTSSKQGESSLETAVTLTSQLENLKTIPANSPHCSEIDHLIASIPCEKDDAQSENSSLRACTWIDRDGLEINKLLSQIGRELGAFSDGPKLRLDT